MKAIKYLLAFAILFSSFSCETSDDDIHIVPSKPPVATVDPAKPNKKAEWITKAFTSLVDGTYEKVKAVSWWHEDFGNSFLTVNSSPQSLKAYKDAVSNSAIITDAEFVDGKLQPSDNGVYHAAKPSFGGTEDQVTAQAISDFESLVGKNIAWAYFSHNWFNGLEFPTTNVNIIHDAGKVPFIRLMPRSDFRNDSVDPNFSMQQILDGEYDDELKAWAEAAAALDYPILAEFGTEVNGKWFPWNGTYNGADTTDGYGDDTVADGPERFRDVYRHIIQICRDNGADNITWFYHVNAYGDPFDAAWNQYDAYYPGDDYIDWLGVSVYGPQEKDWEYLDFTQIMDDAYPWLTDLADKPIAILEIGVTEID